MTVPPSINDSVSSRDVVAAEGARTELHCSASGTPQPTITWRREAAGLLQEIGSAGNKYSQNNVFYYIIIGAVLNCTGVISE